MTTAIASRTGQSSGVGFAIPVGTLERIVPQLITSGRVVRPDAGNHARVPNRKEGFWLRHCRLTVLLNEPVFEVFV